MIQSLTKPNPKTGNGRRRRRKNLGKISGGKGGKERGGGKIKMVSRRGNDTDTNEFIRGFAWRGRMEIRLNALSLDSVALSRAFHGN